jgi:hypothetical protein
MNFVIGGIKERSLMAPDFFRRFLLGLSYRLDAFDKKLQGAINRYSPSKTLTLADCVARNWQNVRPVFVLSTGRCGTMMLNRILQLSDRTAAFHQPRPELIRVSKLAYEKIDETPEMFEEVFRTAREEMMFEVARSEKVYIETNNRITFFAPIISKVFPNSVFIHLVRHPGDFVRSGIRRQWYSGSHEHDLGRIVPTAGENQGKWSKYSNIEKIGWLWNETNQFVEQFGKTVSPETFLFVKAEELFEDSAVSKEIFEFAGLPGFNEKKVRGIIKKPVNVQRKGQYPLYDDWSEPEKEQLRKIAPLAESYGYKL